MKKIALILGFAAVIGYGECGLYSFLRQPIHEYAYNNFLKIQHVSTFSNSLKKALEKIGGPNYPIETIQFVELSNGMTSMKPYVFSIYNKKYVFRPLNMKNDYKTRHNEIVAHQFAASIDVAPEIVYVDDDNTFMIMPFIEGHMLSRDDLKNKKVLASLGSMLSALHAYSGEFDQKRSQVERVRKHYERAIKKWVALPSCYKNLYEMFMKQEETAENIDQVLCHGDLNPANILVSKESGKMYFIDLTSGTWDDRYTDLGYFSFVNGLDDKQSKIFLAAYFGKEITNEQWNNYKEAQKKVSFLTAIVWFDFSESELEKNIPMAERIKKLDALLESPDLRMGQDYLAKNEIVSLVSGNTEAIKLYALGFLKTYLKVEK